MMSAMKESLETFKLIYYQLAKGSISRTLPRDLQKAFKQENAKDGIAMHNSKYCPKNDVEIYWRKFS